MATKNNTTKKETLTPLIIAFVDAYLKSNRVNAAQAMRDAGYRENDKKKQSAAVYANQVLKKPKVLKYLKKRAKEIADYNQVTPEWVVSIAKRNAEKALKGYPVYDKEGNILYNKTDSSGVNGALAVISRITGMEKTAIEHSIKNGDGSVGVAFFINNEEPKKDEQEQN